MSVVQQMFELQGIAASAQLALSWKLPGVRTGG